MSMNFETKLERLTCAKLARIVKKKYTLDEVCERHQKAHAHYRTMVLCEQRTYVSPELILDDVAYVNALARYAATRGIHLKEIH